MKAAKRWGMAVLAGGVALSVGGCTALPRDARGSTEQIRRTHLLVVGVAGEASDRAVADREKRLVTEIARRLGARVRYQRGNTHQLLEQLEDAKLPLVAAQIPRNTPFADTVGLSQPFWKDGPNGKDYCLAVAPGENQLLLLVDQVIAEERRSQP